MGLRQRIARWASPEPLALLARYEKLVDPVILGEFERALAGGAFERTAPIDVTPPLAASLGLPGKNPSDTVLVAGSMSTADLGARALAHRMAELVPVLKIRRRVRAGTVSDELVDQHVALDRLLDPHPDFTIGQLLSTSTKQMVTTGESYWAKIRNGFGLPAAFQILQPGSVDPVVKGGVVQTYILRDAAGKTLPIDPRDMLRFWMPDAQTLYMAKGYLAPNWLNHVASVFAEEHLRNFFEHDATPHTYLQGQVGATPPGEASRVAFENMWIQTHHRRLSKSRPPGLVPAGWEMKESHVQKGEELVPLMDYWMRQMLMNFNVPRAVVGEVVSGDRSSAETMQYVFDRHAVAPIAKIFADTLTVRYAREFDPRLFFAFEGFIDKDKEFELRKDEVDSRIKARSPKQIIADRGGDPEEAPWGEFPVGSLADAPYTGEVVEEEPEAEPGDVEDGDGEAPEDSAGSEETDEEEEVASGRGSTRRGVDRGSLAAGRGVDSARAWTRAARRRKKWLSPARTAARTVFTQQENLVVSALENQGRSLARITGATIDAAVKAVLGRLWKVTFEPVRKRAYRSSGQEAIDTVGGSAQFELTANATAKLARYGASMIRRVDGTTRAKLRSELVQASSAGESASQIVSRVRRVFDVRRAQATAIARTEMLRATEDAQIDGFKQSGVVERKKWNSSQDDRVRDSHIEDEIEVVDLDEPFVLANGLEAEFPGDGTLPAEDVINCRCFVTPEFE